MAVVIPKYYIDRLNVARSCLLETKSYFSNLKEDGDLNKLCKIGLLTCDTYQVRCSIAIKAIDKILNDRTKNLTESEEYEY